MNGLGHIEVYKVQIIKPSAKSFFHAEVVMEFDGFKTIEDAKKFEINLLLHIDDALYDTILRIEAVPVQHKEV